MKLRNSRAVCFVPPHRFMVEPHSLPWLRNSATACAATAVNDVGDGRLVAGG